MEKRIYHGEDFARKILTRNRKWPINISEHEHVCENEGKPWKTRCYRNIRIHLFESSVLGTWGMFLFMFLFRSSAKTMHSLLLMCSQSQSLSLSLCVCVCVCVICYSRFHTKISRMPFGNSKRIGKLALLHRFPGCRRSLDWRVSLSHLCLPPVPPIALHFLSLSHSRQFYRHENNACDTAKGSERRNAIHSESETIEQKS